MYIIVIKILFARDYKYSERDEFKHFQFQKCEKYENETLRMAR